MKEAMFYTNNNDVAECRLCPVGCNISDGASGFCKIRKNNSGILYAEYYGLISSISLDPIEKKPLYHFHPGSGILSIGGYSCNMRCPFCQNHEISMDKPALEYIRPEALAELAEKHIPNGNIGIAYTYNEPFINYEYLLDCCREVKKRGLKNVIITNGYVNDEPLKYILPFVDAFNIDLKGGRDFYSEIKGGLDDVKRTVETVAQHCHVEVTTLVIPSKNDKPAEIDAAAAWLASISPQIPLHLSRFFPRYRFTEIPPTSKNTLFELREIAKKHLQHVYVGNV